MTTSDEAAGTVPASEFPQFPEYITIKESTGTSRRYYAQCSEHPQWRPGMVSYVIAAASYAQDHLNAQHDGIDQTGMPGQLVVALTRIGDVHLRRQIADAARYWVRREVRVERFRQDGDDA